jgi:branched-subunit amino acid transport protein
LPEILPDTAFSRGARDALGVPAAVLAAGMIGFGAFALEYGFSIWLALACTAGIWALPGQIVLVEMHGTGAPAERLPISFRRRMDARGFELWVLVLASAAATYVWRGLGVLLSGRIRVESELFKWVACVAYAMVAGLIMRIIVMPGGLLAQSQLSDRLAACALALVAFYATRKNLFAGVITGVAVVIAAGHWRGLL